MNKDRIDTGIEILVGGYPLQFTLPILLSVGSDKNNLIINNGSVSLVDLGKEKFFITCNHVIEAFNKKLNNKSPNEKYLFQVGNFPMPTKPPIIDHNNVLDLVTIKITDADYVAMKRGYNTQIGNSFIKTIDSSDIEDGDEISFGGFPGDWKTRIDCYSLKFFTFSAASAIVSSVKDNEIICQLDDLNNWPKLSGKKDALSDPGGLSGSPAFIQRKTESGLIHWGFIGIVISGTFLAGSLLVYIRRANCINQDGTINSPNPYF